MLGTGGYKKLYNKWKWKYALKLLNRTGHYMYQQLNIQQLYALPTPYLCVLYLSEGKTANSDYIIITDWFL